MVGEPPRASSAPTRPARLVPRVAAERIAADVRTWAEAAAWGATTHRIAHLIRRLRRSRPRSSPFDQK